MHNTKPIPTYCAFDYTLEKLVEQYNKPARKYFMEQDFPPIHNFAEREPEPPSHHDFICEHKEELVQAWIDSYGMDADTVDDPYWFLQEMHESKDAPTPKKMNVFQGVIEGIEEQLFEFSIYDVAMRYFNQHALGAWL